jgi:phosphohistidine phosphatase
MIARIDLLRHGAAVPAGPGGDALRALSAEGAATIRMLAAALARSDWRPERAFSSPLTRARETTTILLREAGVSPPVSIMPELATARTPEDLALAVATALGSARHVLLVGHQPLLGELVGYWTGKPSALAAGEFVSVGFIGEPAPRAGRVAERHTPR